MTEQDRQILDDLNELRISFHLKVAAATKAEGNWAGCDDCDERLYPTQDDVNSLEAAIILIKRLDKQLTELREAGGPFEACFVAYHNSLPKRLYHAGLLLEIERVDTGEVIARVSKEDYSRLTQALKGVKKDE